MFEFGIICLFVHLVASVPQPPCRRCCDHLPSPDDAASLRESMPAMPEVRTYINMTILKGTPSFITSLTDWICLVAPQRCILSNLTKTNKKKLARWPHSCKMLPRQNSVILYSIVYCRHSQTLPSPNGRLDSHEPPTVSNHLQMHNMMHYNTFLS